jgi:hypothetical protein
MSSQQPPRPPRRYRIRFFFIPVGLIVAFVIYLVHLLTGAQTVTGDFRDPSVLARAVAQGAQRNGDGTPFAEGCTQTVFPTYFCWVDFYGGDIGNYTVTVAVNGSSWYAS